MLIPPKYFLTPTISEFLNQIEASKEIVNSIIIPSEVEQNIRRKSTLKSSLFSARIRGNPTPLIEFPKLTSDDQKRIEKKLILQKQNVNPEDLLLPRGAEIYLLI